MGLIVFRADASADIGGGHVYRCLTLADALKQKGKDVLFVCRQEIGHLADLIQQRGFDVTLIPVEKPIDEHNDAKTCRQLLQLSPPTLVVVDHYQLSAKWHSMIAPLTQHLCVIDDLADRPYQCDLLFDQSVGRTTQDYKLWLTTRCKTVISGAKHALLGPDFIALREQAITKRANTKSVKTMLVAMGATDPDNVCMKVLQHLEHLEEAKNWTIYIPLTDKAKHLDALKVAIKTSPLDIQLFVNVTDMAGLILQADIAIAAAGTSMLERCCLGLPTVLVCLADNQRHITQAVTQNQCAIAVMEKSQLAEKLNEILHQFINTMSTKSADNYRRIADNAFTVCNGNGTDYLVSQLQRFSQRQPLWLTLVTRDDMTLLYQWQIAPKTRQYARDPNPPSPQTHQKWFESVITNEKICFYLIMQGERKCGYVRIHPTTQNNLSGFEVSIALAPDAYGMGIGHKALLLLQQLHSEKNLLAYIEADNKSSIKAFTKAEYTPLSPNWYQHPRTTDES